MRKKILYVCTEEASGMVPYACSIINCMKHSEDNAISVLYLIDKKDMYSDLIDSSIPCYTYTIPQNKVARIIFKLYPITLYKQVEQICNTHSIDCIHLLTVDYILTLMIKKIKKKTQVIYTVHDLYPHEYSINFKETIANKFIYKRSVYNREQADMLVTNSTSQYKELFNLYPKKQIYFHPFPTLVTSSIKNNSNMPKELNIEDRKYILFFGNIHKYKGVDLLYNAYIQSNVFNKVKLIIAGKGEYYFPRYKEKETNIIFINRHILDSEVNYLFRNAHCVVYPYTSITQSGVLSLAYYFQTPIIASDTNFFTDNITDNHTGLLFNKGDIKSLINKLNIIYEEKVDIEHMKNQQERNYQVLYSTNGLLEALNNIYK